MLELRRQSFHIFLGISIVCLIYFDLIGAKFLFFMLIVGVLISMVASRIKIPFVEWFLQNFDRGDKIRGRGVLTCVLGSLLSILIFDKNIALASITILALGDSFCHLGKYGKFRIPFNDIKFFEGLLIGVFFATLGALVFVSFLQAFLGSLISMVVESLDLKVRNVEIDDNILIPLVAGTIMSVVALV
jgi:dolichol kinase